MSIQNMCNDFQLSLKNITGIEFDIVPDNNCSNQFNIKIENYVVHNFKAYTVDDFCSALNRYKLLVTERYLTYTSKYVCV